jgi:hypothetical protein
LEALEREARRLKDERSRYQLYSFLFGVPGITIAVVGLILQNVPEAVLAR